MGLAVTKNRFFLNTSAEFIRMSDIIAEAQNFAPLSFVFDLLFLSPHRVCRDKVQRDRVDTVAFACLCRPIVKYMPQVAAAPRTHDLCPHHAEAGICMGNDLAALDLAVEARPATVRVKLHIGGE